MADSIKVEMIKKLDLLHNTIDFINEVKSCPIYPIARDTVVYPLVVILFECENIEARNLSEVNEYTLTISLWLDIKNFNEQELLYTGLNYEEELHETFIHSLGTGGILHGLIEKYKRLPSFEKIIDESLGLFVNRYQLTVLHKYGKPFQKN